MCSVSLKVKINFDSLLHLFAAVAAAPVASRKQCSDEDVWHLPGKIPLSQIRALRALQSDNSTALLRPLYGPRPLAARRGDLERAVAPLDRA